MVVRAKEVILKNQFRSRNELINTSNRKLVKLYNWIQSLWLFAFGATKKGRVTEDQVSDLRKDYDLQMEKARVMRDRIEDLNGAPVPQPPHFFDCQKIFE